MKKLIAIGEALIDFTPLETGKPIKDTCGFAPHVGGAPANVCGAFVRLGGEAVMLTQLGDDPFGDKIVEELEDAGIDVSYISRTQQANTSLAFVALMAEGNREFSFFRKPGADMLYAPEQVPQACFADAYALHFCSVSLGDYPMKEAHKQAITYAKKAGALVSFDPNLRLQLWPDAEALRRRVQDFLPLCDILKLSDEEVAFITGTDQIEKAVPDLFAKGISVVIYTKGKEGASVYTKQSQAHVPGQVVKAVDTTGAGDGFIGAFLNELAREEKTLAQIQKMEAADWEPYLAFANDFCSYSVQKTGAIASYVTREEMENKK